MEYLFLPVFPNRMGTRYSPAATRDTSAAPAAAPARLPCAARHQLWHLSSPLLRVLLLLLVALPGAAWAQTAPPPGRWPWPVTTTSPTRPVPHHIMTPQEVIALTPSPLYIQYQ